MRNTRSWATCVALTLLVAAAVMVAAPAVAAPVPNTASLSELGLAPPTSPARDSARLPNASAGPGSLNPSPLPMCFPDYHSCFQGHIWLCCGQACTTSPLGKAPWVEETQTC